MSEAPRRYPEIVVATGNRGKLIEIRAILGDLPASLRALDAFPEVALPPEGEDYEANAATKARVTARDSGRIALADDSGLEVLGLEGRPGPLSARYGGEGLDDAGRVGHLLAEMAGLEGEGRRARFVCVAALATPEGKVHTVRGECPGTILPEPQGAGGFGYDPVFLPDGEPRSMAQLPPAKKNAISHRARAFAALREAIDAALADLRG